MSKIDEKYITALESFTKSLDQVVEILKEQQKSDKVDVVNEMLKSVPENLERIVNQLKETTEKGFAEINISNQKILNSVIDKIKDSEIITENIFKDLPKIVEDVFNQLRTTIDKGFTDINIFNQKIIDDVKVVKNVLVDVKNKNQEILEKLESIRKQRESGLFDKVEDPKNKNKIVSGIKTVILIAGGVLAIGMAFKVIGKVDFLSIVALSTAMFLIASTYSKISDIKGISYKKVLMLSLSLPLMSTGLLLSALILKKFPSFTLMQGISILLVGGTLSIAVLLLVKAVEKLNSKSLLMVPLIPIMLPLIALAIVKSSSILKDIQSITLAQAFSVALVGLALGAAVIGISFALKFMKNVTWKELIILPLAIPLIATSIVIASELFQDFRTLRKPMDLLVGSLTIGLSLLFFTPVVYFMGKFNMSQILNGSLAILAISGAILATALIFSLLPDNMIYPEIIWSLGAGLSITTFGLLSVAIGFLATLPATSPFFWAGLISILAVAGSMVGVSLILGKGKWDDKYPRIEWSLGVGTSLLTFGTAIVLSSVAGFVGAISAFLTGEDPLVRIANSMVAVSLLLQSGVWDKKYPSYQWSLGVGTALTLFATAYGTILAIEGIGRVFTFLTGGGKSESFGEFVLSATSTMIKARDILSSGDWNTTNYPKYEWSLGVGTALGIFAAAYAVITGIEGINRVLSFFIGGDSQKFNSFVTSASESMKIAAITLGGISWDSLNYPKKEYSDSVGGLLLSLAQSFSTISKTEGFNSILNLFSGDKSKDFNSFVQSATDSMITASKNLGVVNWDSLKYPSKQFSEGIGEFLISMASAYRSFNSMGFFDLIGSIFGVNKENISLVLFAEESSKAIVAASKILSDGTYGNIPDENYIEKFKVFSDNMVKIVKKWDIKGNNFSMFASAINDISKIKPLEENTIDSFSKFLNYINNMPNDDMFNEKIDNFKKLADSLLNLSVSFSKLNSSLNSFLNISKGLFLISIIDDVKLGKVLKSIQDNQAALSVVYKAPEEQTNLLSIIKSLYKTVPAIEKEVEKETLSEKKLIDSDIKKQDRFYNDISDIKTLLYQLVENSEKPSQAGSFKF